MGRKIPGKKHQGVKDPNKQRAKRLAELKTKINAPPKNIDEQPVPKSLERVIKLKNDVKNNVLVQKKKKKKKSKLIQLGAEQHHKPVHPKAKPEKIVPIFSQKPQETEHQFWNRVNRETHAFIKESEFEAKYNVEVKRNSETGDIEGVVKKPKDEFSELEKLRLKHKNINKKKKTVDPGNNVKLSRHQKKQVKLLKKKELKDEDKAKDFNSFKDEVKFGDIVHAPPVLKIPKAAENNAKSSVKAKTKSLILNSILKENESSKRPNSTVINRTVANRPVINRTGKRKSLPIGERRQLEKQQTDVMAAYKLLKARKLATAMST